MLDPILQTTQTLEANMRLYGIDYSVFQEWSNEDAERVSAIILEWSKR
jgi:hypothetical protein